MEDGDEVNAEVEKVEVEKVTPKKVRKPMSEESLQRIAKARLKANQVRKELKAADFTGSLDVDEILCVEAGFIAQDIQNVP